MGTGLARLTILYDPSGRRHRLRDSLVDGNSGAMDEVTGRSLTAFLRTDGDIAAYRGLSNGGFCQVGRRPAESRNEDGLWWTEKRSEGKVGMVLGRFEDSVHRHQRRTLRVGLALVLSIAGGSRTSSRLLSAAL